MQLQHRHARLIRLGAGEVHIAMNQSVLIEITRLILNESSNECPCHPTLAIITQYFHKSLTPNINDTRIGVPSEDIVFQKPSIILPGYSKIPLQKNTSLSGHILLDNKEFTKVDLEASHSSVLIISDKQLP